MSKFDFLNGKELPAPKLPKSRAIKPRKKMIVHLPSELQGRVSSISVGHLASAKRLHDRILLSFKEVVVFGVGFIFHIGVRGNAVYPGTGANVPSELLNYYITHIDGKDIFIARAGSGTI